MTDFADTWGSANPDAAGNDNEAPLGDHTVALTAARAYMSKKKNEPWVSLTLKVVVPRNGIEAGYEWDELFGFRSQKQANVTKKTVRDLGVDVDNVGGSITDLHDALQVQLGKYYEVEVVQSGDWRNTYIKGEALGSDIPTDAPQADVPEAEKEDIPF